MNFMSCFRESSCWHFPPSASQFLQLKNAMAAGSTSMEEKSGAPMSAAVSGMQIAGGAFQEELIFSVAHTYEQATDWHKRRPQMDIN